MRQIWNDTDFTLSGQTRPVRITVDGKEIFRGVLNAYPNEEDVSMLINKVCEPFLEIDYPENTGVTSHPEAYRIFTVEDWSGNTLGSQDFIYDWSYETWRPVMSNPVNGKLDPRMRLPYTMWRSAAGSVDIDTIEPKPSFYTYEIQAPANYYTDGGYNKLFSINTENTILSGISAVISDSYNSLSVSQTYSNQIDFLTNYQYLPTGYTGNIQLKKDGRFYNSLKYVATSRFNGGVLSGRALETIKIEMLDHDQWTTHMGGFEARNSEGMNCGVKSTSTFNYFDIRWGTLIYKGLYVGNQSQAMASAYTQTALTISKSSKTNKLYVDTIKSAMPFNYSITLDTGGYCSYYVRNRGASGLTDIYIADTVSWFNGLTEIDMGYPNEKNQYKRGKYLDSPFSVTVHCTDGTIIWQPYTYST